MLVGVGNSNLLNNGLGIRKLLGCWLGQWEHPAVVDYTF